ncbi:MAG: peptidase M28, partial [Eudoraea sp.]|nr:peptidase M28 [Eudoraea sp.]
MKKIIIPIFFVMALACKKTQVPKVSLQEDVAFLSSDSLQGRETGTPNELKAAEYLRQRMSDLGLEPKGNAGTYFQTFSFRPKSDPHQKIEYTSGDSTITGTNVIGFLDNKARNTIVIGAHYDHLGLGGEGSLH